MNNIGLLFFLAILPVILILIFVYNKDKSKEPIVLLLQLFGLGIISCLLVLGLSKWLSLFVPFMKKDLNEMNFIETLLYSFIGVGFVEEFCKWIMLYFRGYHSKEFDEIYDIIVYAVFVSLGFGFIENIIYVFLKNDISVALIRGISAVPGHACDAIFMGYNLSVAKQFHYRNQDRLERKYIIFSILVPTLLHGIYDFCLFSKLPILIIAFLIFVIVLYIISIKKLKVIANDNNKLINKNQFCNNCGAKLEALFCSRCGYRSKE